MVEKVYIPAGFDSKSNSMQTLCGLYGASSITNGKATLVLMLHSIPNSMKSGFFNLFGDLESKFANKSYGTLRFDFRGCGESDGDAGDVTLSNAKEDITSVLDWLVSKRRYSNIIIIGEGVGASLAMDIAADKKISAIVMISPCVDLNKIATEVYGYVPDGDISIENSNNISATLLKEMYDADASGAIKKIKIPVLIQHGTKDDIVSSDQIDLMREYCDSPRVDITMYFEGEHGLPDAKHRESILFHVCGFVERHA